MAAQYTARHFRAAGCGVGKIRFCHLHPCAVIILALETSTEICSAALWLDGKVDAREVVAGQRNSELLLPMVDALLAANQLAMRDLDGVAFGSGPGAFYRRAHRVRGRAGHRVRYRGAGGGDRHPDGAGGSSRRAPRGLLSRCAHGRGLSRSRTSAAATLVLKFRPRLVQARCGARIACGRVGGCGSGFAIFRDELMARYAGKVARVIDGVIPHAREIAVLAARNSRAARRSPPRMRCRYTCATRSR